MGYLSLLLGQFFVCATPTQPISTGAAAHIARKKSVHAAVVVVPRVSMPISRSPDISRPSDCWIDRCATLSYSPNTARSCAWLLQHRTWLNADSSVPQRASPARYNAWRTRATVEKPGAAVCNQHHFYGTTGHDARLTALSPELPG